MMGDITPGTEVIDVRDIIEEIEYLRDELDAREHAGDREQLSTLESFMADICEYGGDEQWEGEWYPLTLILDSYFTEYAQQFAEDIGAVNTNAQWPNNFIDWEAAADALRDDYTEHAYGGYTYLTR